MYELEILLNDPQCYVDEHFGKFIRDIDLHFERRQPRDDETRMDLINEVIKLKSNIVRCFKTLPNDVTDVDEIKSMLQNYNTYTLKTELIRNQPVIGSLNERTAQFIFQMNCYKCYERNPAIILCPFLSDMPNHNDKITLNEIYSTVTEFSLSNSGITSIDMSIFDKFNNITYLSLAGNMIEEITINFANLTTLHIDRNKIKYLKRDMFKNLTKVRLLSVEFNPVESIESDVFDDLASVQRIYIDKNIRSLLDSKYKSLNILCTLSN